MNFVVAVSHKGPQTMKRDDGKEIAFNNVYLSYITDDVPARYQDGELKLWGSELKLGFEKVDFIGVDSPKDLAGKFVEFGVAISGGVPVINKVFVVPAPTKNTEAIEAFAESLLLCTSKRGSK